MAATDMRAVRDSGGGGRHPWEKRDNARCGSALARTRLQRPSRQLRARSPHSATVCTYRLHLWDPRSPISTTMSHSRRPRAHPFSHHLHSRVRAHPPSHHCHSRCLRSSPVSALTPTGCPPNPPTHHRTHPAMPPPNPACADVKTGSTARAGSAAAAGGATAPSARAGSARGGAAGAAAGGRGGAAGAGAGRGAARK